MQIRGDTEVVAVLGYPVRHSCSPEMHNAAFEALGLNWCYVALEVAPERIEAAFEGIRALGLKGVNVTIPHKEAALRLVDEAGEEARLAGAANTVLNQGGRLKGFNTDVEGFLLAAKEGGVALAGKRVLVLGAGGAARGIGVSLLRAGAESVVVTSRRRERAAALADTLNALAGRAWAAASALEVREMAEAGPYQVVVNVTPAGMWPNVGEMPPAPWEAVAEGAAVLDTIYNPRQTMLLETAAGKGFRTLTGLGMLLYQGALALEIWTGREAPLEVMRQALDRALDLKKSPA